MNQLTIGSSALLTLTLIMSGCASTPEPHTALAEAQAEVSVAEATGAQEVPEASLHLKMAKDAITEAERLMQENKNAQATAVLSRAQLDAELAASLAQEQDMKTKAQEQLDRVKSLEQTNNQQTTPVVPG